MLLSLTNSTPPENTSSQQSSDYSHGVLLHDFGAQPHDVQSGFLVFVVLNIWATFSNVLVLVVMCQSRSLRRSFGCVVVSLSSVDLLTSLLITPLAIYYYYNCASWHFGRIACIGWVTANVFLVTASICHHCAIAINRYLAVAKPHQQSHMKIVSTKRLLYRVILPSWSAGLLLASILGFQAGFDSSVVVSALPPSAENNWRQSFSCGVETIASVYTSIASLVPLMLTLAANVSSILLLRERLRRREAAHLSSLAVGPSGLLSRQSNFSSILSTNEANSNVETTDDDGSILTMANRMAAQEMGVIVHVDHSGLKKPETSLANKKTVDETSSCCNWQKLARMIDIYLMETDGESSETNSNWNRTSIRKRLTSRRRKTSAGIKVPTDENKITGKFTKNTPKQTSTDVESASKKVARRVIAKPRSLSLSSAEAALKTVDDANSLQVPNSATPVVMESIKEDDYESSQIESELTPLPQFFANKTSCRRTTSQNTIVSMSSVLFRDEYGSFLEDLNLCSAMKANLSTFSFVGDGDDISNDSDFCSDESRQHLHSDLNYVAIRNTTRRNGSRARKSDNNQPAYHFGSVAKGRNRKRAFSIDLPLQYIFAQKAPLAKFESKSSFSIHKIAEEPVVPPKGSKLSKHSTGNRSYKKVRDRSNTNSKSVKKASSNKKVAGVFSKMLGVHSFTLSNNRRMSTMINPAELSGLATTKVLLGGGIAVDDSISSKSPIVSASEETTEETTEVRSRTSSCKGQVNPAAKKPVCHPPLVRAASLQARPTYTKKLELTENSKLLDDRNASPQQHSPLSKKTSNRSVDSTNTCVSYDISSNISQSGQSEAKVMVLKRRVFTTSSVKGRRSFMWSRDGSIKSQTTKRQGGRFRNRERQAERALILVLLFLICLWLPYFLTNLVFGICPTCVSQGIHDFLHIFAVSSTGAINPLVYIFASRDFKKGLVRLFKKRKFKERNAFSDRKAKFKRQPSAISTLIASYQNDPEIVIDKD